MYMDHQNKNKFSLSISISLYQLHMLVLLSFYRILLLYLCRCTYAAIHFVKQSKLGYVIVSYSSRLYYLEEYSTRMMLKHGVTVPQISEIRHVNYKQQYLTKSCES